MLTFSEAESGAVTVGTSPLLSLSSMESMKGKHPPFGAHGKKQNNVLQMPHPSAPKRHTSTFLQQLSMN